MPSRRTPVHSRARTVEPEEEPVAPAKPDFSLDSFPEQQAFIEDPARLKVVLGTRRMGKSYSLALLLCQIASANAGCDCLYVGLTCNSSKKAIWRKGLKKVNAKFELGATFRESDLTMTLPNQSVIYVMGMDASEDQREKARGGAYALVVVDEAASFGVALESIYADVLKPAITDYRGTICLTGTPGLLKKGLFFELTKGQDPGQPGQWTVAHLETGSHWSGHRWNTHCNPHLRKNWEEEIAEMVAVNPLIAETPSFQRERLGRWVTDDSKLVYKYSSPRNVFSGELPRHRQGHWHFALAIDLGWADATSFTVAAWHDHDRTLYFVHSHKKTKLDITGVVKERDRLKAQLAERFEKVVKQEFDFDVEVVDGANKQAVEEMRNRHGLPLIAADKREKAEFIELMNGDFVSGRILVDATHCVSLTEEWAAIVWDEKANRRQTMEGCEDHCADGALYDWRHCYQYTSNPLPVAPRVGSEAWAVAEEDEMEQLAERRVLEEQLEQRELDEWAS